MLTPPNGGGYEPMIARDAAFLLDRTDTRVPGSASSRAETHCFAFRQCARPSPAPAPLGQTFPTIAPADRAAPISYTPPAACAASTNTARRSLLSLHQECRRARCRAAPAGE